ncbi:hypothetical protein P2C57_04545, partial [Xanthomonas perforans]
MLKVASSLLRYRCAPLFPSVIGHDASGRKTIAEHETSGTELAKVRRRCTHAPRIAAGKPAGWLAIVLNAHV